MTALRSAAGLGAVATALVLLAAPPAQPTGDLCIGVPTVFDGDPCDSATGPLPMLPGVSLVLPEKGPRGLWSEGPPTVSNGLIGDVDMAVRVGSFPTETEIPAPAGSAGNPTLLQNTAGGGGSSQGSTVPFTVFATDGPGGTDYGVPLAGLHERPLAVFGYADLDGDGVIGPTNSDGSGDNELEKQEALAHVGRQVGQIDGDRFSNSLAVRIGAPASIGGLRISLAGGMYTGDDPSMLWSNGTPIFTNWPFFPPLDPLAVVYLAEANPPDPSGPNIIFYQPSEFFLPPPNTPDLEQAFVVATDGSNASTDQYLSLSGPAVGVRLFRDVELASFTASSRLAARPAPPAIGPGRKLVTPAGEVAVEMGQEVKFRVLPVDSLGNIADPDVSGVPAKLRADGGLRILQPDKDGDPYWEIINVDTARGVSVKLSTNSALGRARLTVYDPPPALPTGLDQAVVFVTASGHVDADDDGIEDDGDGSGTIGDTPCSAEDMVASTPCDDNCPNVVNPTQSDSDGDGQGNCCDGACVIDDGGDGCIECPQAASRYQALTMRARMSIRPRGGFSADGVKLKTVLRLQDGQSISPDGEEVEVTIAEGNRLHYFVQLPGLFTVSNDGPTWVYDDPDGAIGGLRKAQLRTTSSGIKAKFVAKQVNLVDTQPAESLANGLVLAITIGDDTFTRHLKCQTTLSVVRCVSTS